MARLQAVKPTQQIPARPSEITESQDPKKQVEPQQKKPQRYKELAKKTKRKLDFVDKELDDQFSKESTPTTTQASKPSVVFADIKVVDPYRNIHGEPIVPKDDPKKPIVVQQPYQYYPGFASWRCVYGKTTLEKSSQVFTVDDKVYAEDGDDGNMKDKGWYKSKDTEATADDRTDKIALAAIYQGIPEDILLALAEKKTAKEAWEAIRTMFQGAERVRTAKVHTLKAEFEAMAMRETDSLDDFYLKMSGIVTNIRTLGEEITESAYGHFAAECKKPRREKEIREEANIAQIPEDEPALLLTEVTDDGEAVMLINEENVVPKLKETKE
ncbi:hypothetical protein AgCh_034225 [Apium graveolens]